MFCTGIYPCAEDMSVLKNALGRSQCGWWCGGCDPCPPAQLWGQASPALCSQLWPWEGTARVAPATAGGLPRPTDQRRCLEIQHHQQKVFRGFGYVQLRSVKAAPGQA